MSRRPTRPIDVTRQVKGCAIKQRPRRDDPSRLDLSELFGHKREPSAQTGRNRP